MRIATKGIFAVEYEPVKELRLRSPKRGSVFCARQNTLPISDKSTRQGAFRPRRVFCRRAWRHGHVGESSPGLPRPLADGTPCQAPLHQAPGRVLVQKAGDQGLVGKTFFDRTLLNGRQVFLGDADVDATVLSQRSLSVLLVSLAPASQIASRTPLTPLHAFRQSLLIGIQLSHLDPHHRDTASLPCGSE